MVRILFFLMGVPMMIMSFFEVIDVLPFVSQYQLIVDGNVVELTEEESQNLQTSIEQLFENSYTMPAFGVVFDEMYKEEIKNGYFVSMKFESPIEVNGLPFDELVFKVEKDFQGVNLMRGNKGIFQGRCIYLNLQEKNMENLYNLIEEISQNHVELNDSDKASESLDQTQTENLPDSQI